MAAVPSEAAWYVGLDFVRTAGPGDESSLIQAHGTLWRDPDNGEQVWLTPGDVQKRGLTDKMREALAREQGWEAPLEPEPETPSHSALPTITGGHTVVWRWSFVRGDDDEVIVALDNLPGVKAAAARVQDGVKGAKHLSGEQIRVPADVVQAIAKMLES